MPSYNIYKINRKIQLSKEISPQFLQRVKAAESDPETTKDFITTEKKSFRNIATDSLESGKIFSINLEQKVNFPEDQHIWLAQEVLLLNSSNHLLIGKSAKNFEKLLSIYLRDRVDLTPISFQNKNLWKFWARLKRTANTQNIDIKLHRIILQKAYIFSSLVEGLNIQAKDVENIETIRDLVETANRVDVITFKLLIVDDDLKKWYTLRIDRKGSLLIYGHPSTTVLTQFTEIITKSL